MLVLSREEAENLLQQAEQNFIFSIRMDIFSKLQLLLTLSLNKGIEFFGSGYFEMRYPFMFIYGDLILRAVQKKYRVFVKKEGILFRSDEWFLEFVKK